MKADQLCTSNLMLRPSCDIYCADHIERLMHVTV